MVKQGDQVEVSGTIATVEAMWGQGRHTAYRLSDGRVILDLAVLIDNGDACIVAEVDDDALRSKPLSDEFYDLLEELED